MPRPRPTPLTWLASSALSALLVCLPAAAAATDDASPPDEAMAAELGAILASMPEAVATTDGEQLISLIGLPDAFSITFEPGVDGSVGRRDAWTYFDLATTFELLDGQLLADTPLHELPPLLIKPPPYDPTSFTAGASWESLGDIVLEAAAFEAVALDEDYALPATAYVGDFLLLLFDEGGGLFHVETLPLAIGAGA